MRNLLETLFGKPEEIKQRICIPIRPKLIFFEKLEDLQPLVDAALLLDLEFIIYNRNIGSEEHQVMRFCFELKERSRLYLV